MGEPRTTAEIMRDLLEQVVEHEWAGQRNTSCGCHPEYNDACPSCDNFKYVPHAEYRARQPEDRTHAPSCELAALITETEAFLRAEDDLAEASEDAE